MSGQGQQRQYSFRIKPGSEVALALDDVIGNNESSKDSLRGKFSHTALGMIWDLSRNCDNFSISRSGGVTYTDIIPNTMVLSQTIQAESVNGTGATPQVDNQPVEQIRYPAVPTIKDPMDFFRKPLWFEAMRTAVKAGKHISLSGPPGIGKSTAVEQLAAEEHVPLIHVGADAGLRRRDLTGQTELINGHTSFMMAEYAAAAMFGWWAIIDEANAAEPDAIMSLNGQIAPPYMVNFYGKSAPVHPNFRLFITYNHGLVGTKPLPDSFKDRFFPIKLGFPTDYQLRQLLLANGMPETGFLPHSDTLTWDVAGRAIIRFARLVWEAYETGKMRYQITPRRLMDSVFLMSNHESIPSASSIAEALDMAVINAVDNTVEAQQLQRILATVKSEVEFGRLP